ncbi:MAG: LD-carboxypeptidase [Acidobacteria bacterium]|nr:LD-carboxypeptidase [Acidobacteriota bacterium]
MLTRRHFLTAAAAAPLLATVSISQTKPLIRPRRLQAGDTVGLITPATFVSDPDALIKAERTIKHFGWRAKWGKNVAKKSGYFGNPVNERLDDLHAMFRDPEVKAVFCVRGGYGAQHLLDRIDYDLIARNPKIFAGYSDITALHLAIHKNTGLVTFHSPVPVSAFTDYTQKHFVPALTETKPLGVLTNPPESNKLRPEHTLRAVRPGKATGRLIGGNLTLISTLMGTPYEPDTRGAIFFIEDVGEAPYRIDRMLTQLRLAGKLQQAAGIVFGECADCGAGDYKPFVAAGFSLGETVDAILGELKIPVLAGLTIGHTDDQLTMPLGVMATLDAEAGTLELKESGVS